MSGAISTSTHFLMLEAFAKHGVTLPLQLNPNEPGEVHDAKGAPVFVVDVNRERPDGEVNRVAGLIVLAVNNCAGFLFRTEPTEETK